ncbi:MAG: nucleotidyltransferase domain-containing protein [Treponema sp.]|nr:nucleotidyltransferase domain-containing protein [Treponema sp.]
MRCGLSDDAIARIRHVFAAYPGVERAVLFGSRAKGNYKPCSDIDIALMGNISLGTKWQIENDLDNLLLPQKMDVVLFRYLTSEDLIAHIKRVGKTLYTRPDSPQSVAIRPDTGSG